MAKQPAVEVALLTCSALAALVWPAWVHPGLAQLDMAKQPAVELAATPEVFVANQEVVAIEVLAAKRLKAPAASTEVLDIV